MTEQQARAHLTAILQSFTLGSVLHLLADLRHEATERETDSAAIEQAKAVEHTLFVVGLGIDSAMPS